MKLDVVIPTYKRQMKLFTCVKSIIEARHYCRSFSVTLHIYFSLPEDMEECMEELAGKDWIKYHLLKEEFKASRFWNNHLKKMDADALCYLSDDTELDSHCLVKGWCELLEMKMDGVVGFRMVNATDGHPCKAAYGMVGKTYANRFPERKVFCPEYWCFFCDSELEEYSKSIEKFVFCEEATLKHFHPSFTKDKPDATHNWHRRHSLEDHSTREYRKKNKLLWGQNYILKDKEEDEIITVKKKDGVADVTFKDGHKREVSITTKITKWRSGRQDCGVVINTPLDVYPALNVNIKKKEVV